MKISNKDFILRIIGTGFKFLSLLLLIKIEKNVVPIFFFYTTLAAFIFKASTLSELNNYKRLTNENTFIKFCTVYFFNCLYRNFFFILFIFIFDIFVELNIEFVPIFFFILTLFIINYLSACFVLNSKQLYAAIVNFIGSIALFISIILSTFLESNLINNIAIIYFIINCVILFVKFGLPKHLVILKKSFYKINYYFLKKNFNLRIFKQLKRGFVSISGYLIVSLTAYAISEYQHIDINLKNSIIVLLYIANVINIYLLSTKIFPHILEISNGKFMMLSLKKIFCFTLLVVALYFVTIFLLPKYSELISIFYAIIIYIFFSYLTSFQDFYIQARSIKFNYFFCFFIALIFNIYLLKVNQGNFIYMPILLILPKISLFTINKICFKKF